MLICSENETGIEMKVMRNDGSHNSVEQAINEASEENSMMSMENVNSIIGEFRGNYRTIQKYNNHFF